MADEVEIVTKLKNWLKSKDFSASSLNGGPGTFGFKQSVETGSGVPDVIELGATDSRGNQVVLIVVGTGDADANGVGRIWGVRTILDGTTPRAIGVPLAVFTFSLGNATVDAVAPLSGKKLADTIVITEDSSLTPPGIRLVGNVDGGVAVMLIDTAGFGRFYVELAKGATNPVTDAGYLWSII